MLKILSYIEKIIYDDNYKGPGDVVCPVARAGSRWLWTHFAHIVHFHIPIICPFLSPNKFLPSWLYAMYIYVL